MDATGTIVAAVEDCFVVMDLSASADRFAKPAMIRNLAEAVEQLHGSWRFLWDVREASDPRDDQVAAYETALDCWPEAAMNVAISPETPQGVRDAFSPNVGSGAEVVTMNRRHLEGSALPLDVFLSTDYSSEQSLALIEDDYLRSHRALFGTDPLDLIEDYLTWGAYAETNRYDSALLERRSELLDLFFRDIGRNSVLTSVAIQVERDRVYVTPYHGHSLHQVPTKDDDLVLVRPGRATHQAWGAFERAIAELESMLNDPRSGEREIEALLLKNPLFLRGLNFEAVYPQVVLPREGGGLRPDVIAEPIDGEWASIVELKAPSVPILAGREGRSRLAHGIHSVVRQLREYSAYFDDRKMAKAVEDKYGFKCYQPRLVAIVGRDPSGFGQEEIRRAMTTYPDVEIVTYDQLLLAAERLLLL